MKKKVIGKGKRMKEKEKKKKKIKGRRKKDKEIIDKPPTWIFMKKEETDKS